MGTELLMLVCWIGVSAAIAYACNGLMCLARKRIWLQHVIAIVLAMPMWLYCLILLNNLTYEVGIRRELVAYYMMAYGISGITMTALVQKRWHMK